MTFGTTWEHGQLLFLKKVKTRVTLLHILDNLHQYWAGKSLQKFSSSVNFSATATVPVCTVHVQGAGCRHDAAGSRLLGAG